MEHCHANVTSGVRRSGRRAARRKEKKDEKTSVILRVLCERFVAEEKLGNEQLIRHCGFLPGNHLRSHGLFSNLSSLGRNLQL